MIVADSVIAEVINRNPSRDNRVAVHLNFESVVMDERGLVARFKLSKETFNSRVFVSGILSAEPSNDEERRKLEHVAKNQGKPDPFLVSAILIRTQPVILHVEELLGVPPLPIPPPNVGVNVEPGRKEGDEGFFIYQ